MTDKKICPLCGFEDIDQSTKNETIYDLFGGHEEVPLAYDRCKRCQTSGDFSKINDTLISETLNRLRLRAVKNILQEFSEHKYSFAGLERSLELPQRTLTKWKNGSTPPNAAGVTLLKFLRIFPWLVEVADLKFDFDAAQRTCINAAMKTVKFQDPFSSIGAPATVIGDLYFQQNNFNVDMQVNIELKSNTGNDLVQIS